MVQLSLRVPDDLLPKVRVLSAVMNMSQNEFIVQTLADTVARWEAEHGSLPVLNQASD
jgi:predicted transcriptional regulator